MTNTIFGKPLNRILIGDVGSGKTLVALIPAITYLYGLESGLVAMLAPTEILARQHYQKLLEIKSKNSLNWLNCLLLTQKEKVLNGRKLKPKELEKFLVQIRPVQSKDDSQNIIEIQPKKVFCIGTQAILFEKKLDPNLVIVDEQHRFGVKQRQILGQNAHFLSMTGTPIPRTLALTMYSSLEPIFLNKLEDRKEIKTSMAVFEKLEQQLIPALKSVIDNDQKAYIVCAKVGSKDQQDEDKEIWSVSKTAKFLEAYFPTQVLQVHGKQKDKQDILEQFRNDTTKNILVATTVIEVGVDVEKATFVAIFNAERFGLATLHQIRGRVGRNNLENNHCLLIVPQKYSRSKRLRYVLESNDGFEIAQKDLELRGSGQLYGYLQSGFEQDFENLVGLDTAQYLELNEIVDSLNFKELGKTLPRLKNYLINRQKDVWSE